jgi:hypothetical protein
MIALLIASGVWDSTHALYAAALVSLFCAAVDLSR